MSFLIYPSSAGSGKTFTLVREYLKIALGTTDSYAFSRILAVTFTNKAAKEMTDRILETLEELGGIRPPKTRTIVLGEILEADLGISNSELKKRAAATLKKIVHNYGDFSVGTIDSFVHKVIRSFASEMGLNQQFEVELHSDLILKRAVDAMIDRIGRDPLLTGFVKNYVDSKFDKGNSWKIDQDLYDFSRKLMETHNWFYLEKAKSVSLEEYDQQYRWLKSEMRKFAQSVEDIAQKAVDYALDGVPQEAYANGGIFIKYFQKILNGEYSREVGITIQKLLNPDAKWISGKGKDYQAEIESKRSILLEYFHEVGKLLDQNSATFYLNKALFDNMFQVALLSEMDKELQKIKQDNELVLISEFNELVSQITRNEEVPFIFEKLGGKYEHFLFDEFQDTSLLQWHNMLPLVENGLAQGQTAMVVGDAKQSIYRWRGGVVEQFGDLPEVYNPYQDQLVAQRGQTLQLNHQETHPLDFNYRSEFNIVEFNNRFFEQVALNSEAESIKSFYTNSSQKTQKKDQNGYVEFQFFYENSQEANVKIQEAILQEILNLKKEGFSYKDIAILMKSKGDTPSMVAYLRQHNIEVISSESLLVKNSNLVKLVVATLNHLKQPQESYYMNEILMRIHHFSPKSNFHAVMGHSKKIKASEFYQILNGWGIQFHRKSLLSLSLYEMVGGILETYGLNQNRDSLLSAWLDYVYECSLRTGFGLFDLLDDWKSQEDKLSIQIPEDLDAVNIMTIHKAKGLDWPIVFLAQGNWQKKHKAHSFWVELPEHQPIPVAYLRHSGDLEKTIFKNEFQEEEEAINLDHINALYVAFTRPQERLYVFSKKPNGEFFQPYFPILEAMKEDSKVNVKFEKIPPKKVDMMVSFTYGHKTPRKVINSSDESGVMEISNRRNSGYLKKLKVRKNYLKRLREDGSRDYGNLVHKVFSLIESSEDVEMALETMFLSGEISIKEKEEIRQMVWSVITHPRLRKWFEPGKKVKNEAEILLANGEILRPDRVVFYENEVTIIDFKTGMRKSEHEQQISAYKIQLMEMGHERVNGLLVYTEEVEVYEV